jgi:enoyl-CoA hydratase/carnithine racemase
MIHVMCPFFIRKSGTTMGNIQLLRDAGIATVIINYPARFNAMSRAMWLQLRSVFVQIQLDTSLKVVVIKGDQHFCAGGDISEYASFRFQEESLRHFHENEVWGALQTMLECDVPIIAQIDGNCMGAGIEIASCCDVRIASHRARFGAPIAKLGFPMAPREAALLMHSVGELTVREMLLTAAIFDAAEMQRRGFLNQVVADTELGTATQTIWNRIQPLSAQAMRLNKQAFRVLTPVNTAQYASNLIASAYCYADTYEHREGISAFVQKRSPRFES